MRLKSLVFYKALISPILLPSYQVGKGGSQFTVYLPMKWLINLSSKPSWSMPLVKNPVTCSF